jgi:hypothetical protein
MQPIGEIAVVHPLTVILPPCSSTWWRTMALDFDIVPHYDYFVEASSDLD